MSRMRSRIVNIVESWRNYEDKIGWQDREETNLDEGVRKANRIFIQLICFESGELLYSFPQSQSSGLEDTIRRRTI